jgi:Uma2 family endonuclease
MAEAQLTHSTASAPPLPARVTIDEYLELCDDAPYEVIDGELIAMTPQNISSSDTAHDLYDRLNPHVVKHKLGRVRMETAFALDIEAGTNWVTGSLVPDVAFISSERLREQAKRFPDGDAFQVAPDLAVEIISPSDRFSIVVKKVARYLKYGVRLVWVIDPENRVIYVYTPDQPDGRALHENDTLTGAPVLPEWSMAVRALLDVKTEAE